MPTDRFRYDEVTYRPGHDVRARSLSPKDLPAVDCHSHDMCLASPYGIPFGHRDSEGRWKECRIGRYCAKIVQAIQINVPAYLTVKDIAEVCGNHLWHENGNGFQRHMVALRGVLGGWAEFRRFFLYNPRPVFEIAWNPKRSWILIERIPQAPAVKV